MTGPSSTFAIEQAARVGDVFAATEVLLDDLEARGELGSGEQVTRLREQIMQIARSRGALWMQQPLAAASDLQAHVLALPELAATRRRWQAELDARGPWLRPLRARTLDSVVVAEQRLDTSLGPLVGLEFEGEHTLRFEHRDTQRVQAWSWSRAQVDTRPLDTPLRRAQAYDDPRFPSNDAGTLYQPTPRDEPRLLPWPEFGHPSARLSSDGRAIFAYGWCGDDEGLLLVIDASTLEVTQRYDFDDTVSAVVDRPGSDELLIATYHALFIRSPRGTRWRRRAACSALAWSPSGRYACVVFGERVELLDTHARASANAAGPGFPLAFSPDGTRLVDGNQLLDARDGSHVATLDVSLGRYLEGGPAMPWYHVGTELIVCIHGGLALWRSTTGEPLRPARPLHAPMWMKIAYARSGRFYALGRRGEIEVAELPTLDPLGTLRFELDIEALALSSDAELVAAYSQGTLEVRTRSGTLVCRAHTPEPRERNPHDITLWFGPDDHTIHILEPVNRGSGPRGEWHRPLLSGTWTLDGDLARWSPTPDPTQVPGWQIETGPFSTFRHESGTTLIVAAQGPWLANPAHPRLLACPGGLFELRATR